MPYHRCNECLGELKVDDNTVTLSNIGARFHTRCWEGMGKKYREAIIRREARSGKHKSRPVRMP